MRALFPGTFNPPTKGHREVIIRAAALFDQLFIGIGINGEKKNPLFSFKEREAMLNEIVKPLTNVKVVIFSGLVVDFVQKNSIDVVVRGLRSVSDFESEKEMAMANRAMNGVETLFLMVDGKHVNIRSSLVREIGRLGHSLDPFIPQEISEIVSQRLNR